MSRRICIPIPFRPHGGGFYFLQAFEAYLSREGWEITRDTEDRYDYLFTNHWLVPYSQIVRALGRNLEARLVHRIDGAAVDYGRDDASDLVQALVNSLADLTVFQSRYARYATREKFHVIHGDGPVIPNPVDVDLFSPYGHPLDLPHDVRVVSVSWSTNPMKGNASLYEVARQNAHAGFFLCGRYPDAPPLGNVHALGVLERAELARALRSCHVLLTFSRHEACPNHVLEGLASGLPVLYYDSGAMSEIVGGVGRPVTVDSFPAELEKLMAERTPYSEAARERAVRCFHPDIIFARYLEHMTALTDAPAKILPSQRRWLARTEPFRGPLRGASDRLLWRWKARRLRRD